MFQKILILFLALSCSSKVIKKGGDSPYLYDFNKNYTSEELKSLSENIVATFQRNPKVGQNRDLFGPSHSPIKRVGIVVFETEIQPTRGGLSGKDIIYLTAAGKQLLTENFLSIWEQSFSTLTSNLTYISTQELKNSKSFHLYGKMEKDFVNSQRSFIDSDDVLALQKGKNTTNHTLINPRGMRDLSLLLIPATELMGGPKWSEHQKHFVNEVAQELKLDAVIIVMSKINWTATQMDKQTGETLPEELKINLSASTLVPFRSYHDRLTKLGIKEHPVTTICYRHYEGHLKIPVALGMLSENQSFSNAQKNLLMPLVENYKNLSQMMIFKMNEDLRNTQYAEK